MSIENKGLWMCDLIGRALSYLHWTSTEWIPP